MKLIIALFRNLFLHIHEKLIPDTKSKRNWINVNYNPVDEIRDKTYKKPLKMNTTTYSPNENVYIQKGVTEVYT